MMEKKAWRIPFESPNWTMIYSISGGIMYLGYLGVFHRTILRRGVTWIQRVAPHFLESLRLDKI
jgi:hypothetical protein